MSESGHVYPSLRFRDASAAIEFLERAFGFEPVSVHENADGVVGHAELRWGKDMIMLGQETHEGIERWGAQAGRGSLYLTTADPDALCDRARNAGAVIVMEPTDLDYGSRDFAARDPEGNLYNFGTYDPKADPPT